MPFRPSTETRRQLNWLNNQFGTDQTVITVAIDRMYREETMTTETSAYDRAVARVDATPELAPYRDLLVEYDWPEGDEHYLWVATTPVAELVDWAKTVREGEADEAD